MVKVPKAVEISENLNRLSRAHERYRRQTDGRATANSERELMFTFAKNYRNIDTKLLMREKKLEMWANAQRDGRPAKHRWRPLFNAANLADAHY